MRDNPVDAFCSQEPDQSAAFHSLVDIIRRRAMTQPDKTAFSFLPDGKKETAIDWNVGMLDRRARAIAHAVQATGRSDGKTVLLMVPAGPDFIASFFGCLYARSIAVPMTPPGLARMARTFSRMARIVEDSGARIIITTKKLLKAVEELNSRVQHLGEASIILADDINDADGSSWMPLTLRPEMPGWLQYTSGSTSDPKGVIITHGNIVANLQSIVHGMQIDPVHPMLHWLPPFHDMGLVGGILTPLYRGCPCVTMPPMAFLRSPFCWLKAISDYKAQLSGAPNFAYDACVERIKDDKLKELDLSCLKVCYCGSEPIRSRTMQRFLERFQQTGLRKEAFYPCYGLAENTLFVTGTWNNTKHLLCHIDSEKYLKGEIACVNPDAPHARTLVSCGAAGINNEVRIVDPDTLLELPDGQLGEVWIKGRCVSTGYWNQPEPTKNLLQAECGPKKNGPFLRTGDLGFLRDGHLYVSGRRKEMIILNGRNYFPQDLEEAVLLNVPGLEQNGAAAFGVQMEKGEALVMVFETKMPPSEYDEALVRIRTHLAEEFDIVPHAVVLVKRHGVPKTTSGKIQQSLCRKLFLEGSLPVLALWMEKDSTPAADWGCQPLPAGLQHEALRRAWEDWLRQGLCRRLGLDSSLVGTLTPFTSYGMKSAAAVSLAAELEKLCGRSLPATLFYDCANIAELADFFASAGPARTPLPKEKPAAGTAPGSSAPAAIVGLALRVPGAGSPEALQKLLFDKKDAVSLLPADRGGVPGHPVWGGFIEDMACFDAAHFGISPREAEEMDPQQRQLLEVSWQALERSGTAPDSLRGSSTGVFVGISSADYENMRLMSGSPLSAYTGTGSARSIAANRLSYFYGLEGPSMSVDSACSSSLLALHLACRSLQNGECSMALVCGVNILANTACRTIFEQAGLMASDGRCKTFSDKADGYVRSEGCVAVVLKPLADALADGSTILGIIRGSAVNQDGASNGLTAPSRKAQAKLLRRALDNAGLSPCDIDYLEAHGTGTPLGDPIEIGAVSDVYAGARGNAAPLVISSVKTNIGHLEAAAGLAGLARVLLCLQAQAISPMLHLERINPQIAPDAIPAVFPTESIPWVRNDLRPRRAGISSFGFGGTNVHVIVEEGPAEAAKQTAAQNPLVLPLSARTEQQLNELVSSCAGYLAGMPADISLEQVCRTAAAGRASLPFRLVLAGEKQILDLAHGDMAWQQKALTGHVSAGAQARPCVLVLDDAGRTENDLPLVQELRSELQKLLPHGKDGAQPDVSAFIDTLSLALSWMRMVHGALGIICTRDTLCAAACLGGLLSFEEALALHGVEPVEKITVPAALLPAQTLPVFLADSDVPVARVRCLALLAAGKAAASQRIEEGSLNALLASRFAGAEVVVLGRMQSASPDSFVSVLPQTGDSSAMQAARALAALWVRGVAVDWKGVYSAGRLKNVLLPTYPFARERCWFAKGSVQDNPVKKRSAALSAAGIAAAKTASRTREEARKTAQAFPKEAAGSIAADSSRKTGKNAGQWLDILVREAKSVLHLKKTAALDPNASLISAGFDSLLFMELAQRLRRQHGRVIEAASFMQTPSLTALASVLSQAPGTGEGDGEEEIVPDAANRYKPFPLSDVQHAYWLGRNKGLELGGVSCSSYLEADLRSLDLARLENALNKLIARHDMLRCVFTTDGMQRILPSAEPYHIELEDLSSSAADAKQERLLAKRESLSHAVLPTDKAPLWDIRATRLDKDTVRLHVKLDLLVMDVFSFGVMARDLADWYHTPDREKAALSLSFRDCVLSRAQRRSGTKYAQDKAYWLSRLRTLPEGPALPLAKEPHTLGTPKFTRRLGELDAERWSRLKSRARQFSLTPSALLLSAFSLVLSRWSQSPAFCLMLTTFDRDLQHPEVLELVGDFTQLQLLEVSRQPGSSLLTHAFGISSRLAEDMKHASFSAVEVLRALNASGSGSRPSSRSAVVFTSALPLTDEDMYKPVDSFDAKLACTISQTPQVWLDHQVSEYHGKLIYSWDAVDELFPENLLVDMFAVYGAFLQRLADDDSAWTEALPLASLPAGQKRVREAVNNTAVLWNPEPLFSSFAAEAASRAQSPAVLGEDVSLSHAELERFSRLLARVLINRGLKKGDCAAVLMEKGWEQAVAVYAVSRAGGVYLPIDSHLPEQRIAYMLHDADVRFIIEQNQTAQRQQPEKADSTNAVRIVLDRAFLQQLESQSAGDADSLPDPIVEAGDLAYIIYTSGSTGRPKGVVLDHAAPSNTLQDLTKRFGLNSKDRVLSLASLSFDLSVFDMFALPGAGGAIVLPDPARLHDPSHWCRLMREHHVTIWNTTPSLMQLLLDHIHAHPDQQPQDLRLVILSGDWIPLNMPDELHALWPQVTVACMGGATEAAIWSNLQIADKVSEHWHSIPYGRPLSNQGYCVLDSDLCPCPDYVPGSLYISGAGLARGYLNNAEKTKESFLIHPATGERLYKTGDMGRYWPDGTLEFLGRSDTQVKINGYRVELGEIEAALCRCSGVQKAAVVAVRSAAGDRLAGFVVPEEGSCTQQAKHCRDKAEDAQKRAAMIEAGITLIDETERLVFRQEGHNIRRDLSSCPKTVLPALNGREALEQFSMRLSSRRFAGGPVSAESFAGLMRCLSALNIADWPVVRHQYGSAGWTYAVQVYCLIRPKRVSGFEEGGCYYYEPVQNALYKVHDAVDGKDLFPGHNREIYTNCAFAFFLVADMKAIKPLYGSRAHDFVLLEAGLMSQLLEERALPLKLGLCQIGAVDFAQLRDCFALTDQHCYLHCLLGGGVEHGSGWNFTHAMEESLPDQAEAARKNAGRDADVPPGLREELHAWLPDYMVPSTMTVLDAVPLTGNGKVDRRALAALAKQEKTPAQYLAPAGEGEEMLASIAARVLGREHIGAVDNFFDLGATSMQLVLFQRHINDQLNRNIAITDIFAHSNVRDLAAWLFQDKDGSEDAFILAQNRAGMRRARRRQSRNQMSLA